MPVPEEDIVCRFIRSKDWSNAKQRPKPGAFKQADLSVWHQACLQANNVQLENLQFGSLAQTGQAHYRARDFSQTAKKVKEEEAQEGEAGELDIAIEWRPETVEEAWREWDYAHIEISTVTNCKQLWAAFRRALCMSALKVSPPLEVD